MTNDKPVSSGGDQAGGRPAATLDDGCFDDEDEAICDHCWGEGYYHDCGEDTCCCLHPELDELWPCGNCGGTGYLR